MDLTFSNEWLVFAIILLALLFIILAINLAVGRAKRGNRKMELELEHEKLELLKKDMASRIQPFTRLSDDQLKTLRVLSEENEALEVNNYAKEKIVEVRMRRLENMVKGAKLDIMLKRIDDEEKKVK